MNPIRVQKATPEDASNILRLLLQWHQTTGIGYPPMNEHHTLAWIVNTMIGGHVLVAERSGRLIGVLGIIEQTLPWNADVSVLQDRFFFVAESYRKGGVAAALMTAAKAIAAGRGMPLIMNLIGGTNTEKVDRFYSIQGGAYAGGTYVFGLPAAEGEVRDGAA